MLLEELAFANATSRIARRRILNRIASEKIESAGKLWYSKVWRK